MENQQAQNKEPREKMPVNIDESALKNTHHDDEDSKQFITFSINKQEYGVDIRTVREIMAWTETTVIPNAPSYMRGVINLRGAIVPIYDLRSRFGMGQTEASKTHVIIVLTIGDRVMGVLADAVSDIINVKDDDIQPPPEGEAAEHAKFLEGLATSNDRMVMILDPNQLTDHHLNDKDLAGIDLEEARN